MIGTRAQRAAGLLVGAALIGTLAACSGPGDLSISNDGPSDVTVLTGDEEVIVTAGGGVVLLDYGCTPGDVTVRFASGADVVLPGPVCPDQAIAVTAASASLKPASTDHP